MNLNELGVSYYEIGGEIQTSTVSNVSTVTSLSGAEANIDPDVVVATDVRGVCYANAQQTSVHYPYTGIGHPLVNIGFNALLRSAEQLGLVKPVNDPTQY